MMRKFSSIPSSFASVCWFSALFALCFSSFFFLHPRDKTRFDILNITTEKIVTISTTKHVSNETNVDAFESNEMMTIIDEGNVNATIIELPTSNREQGPNGTIIELVNSTTPTTITPLEEEKDEDYNKIASIDVFANPPWNVSKEERIAWLKEKLDEYKVIKSTSRTINFNAMLQGFLSQGNNSVCKVNIFLTWISPASLFGKREMLALESILTTHPQGCVVILSRTMDSSRGWSLLGPLRDRGHKVIAIAPDFRSLFKDTPAQGWLERLEAGEVDPGTVPITQSLSNLLRVVVLYKFGGVYFDTDMVVLKDVSGLRNSIGIQSVDDETRTWRTLSNAVLIFDKEHPLMWRFMEEFANTFDGFTWGYNGPYLATRVVSKTLEDSKFQFNLLSQDVFYPIDWKIISRLFSNQNKDHTNWAQYKFYEIHRVSYGIHIWNKQTRNLKISRKSVIGRLISSHCIICQDVYDS